MRHLTAILALVLSAPLLFAADLSGEGAVRIPRVFWELTSSRVITMERLEGMKISDHDGLQRAGIDPRELARQAAVTMGEMVFTHGFFHGDPHPGNFFVEPGGRLGLIDFGIVGTIDEALRGKVRRVLLALESRDAGRLASAFIALHGRGAQVDRQALREDLAELIDQYVGAAIGELAMGGLIGSMLGTIRRHHLRIPRDLSLLLRTLLLEEGIVQMLDPSFNLVEALKPYARRSLFADMSMQQMLRRIQAAGLDLADFALEVPEQVRRVVDAIEDGGFDVHLRARELEPLLSRAERLGNRIAVSVLAAAVIDAATQLYARSRPRGRGR